MRASARPEAVAVLAEGGIKERLQHLQQRLLDQTIRPRRDPELVLAPSGLGIATRRTGLGRYVPDNSCSRIAGHAVRSCAAVWSMSRPSTPATPLLARPRSHARCSFSLASALRAALTLCPSIHAAGDELHRCPSHTRIHRVLPRAALLAQASDAMLATSTWRRTLPLVRPFAGGTASRPPTD